MTVTLVLPGQDLHIAATEVDARRLAVIRGIPGRHGGYVLDGADRHGKSDAWEAEPDRIRLWVNEGRTLEVFTVAELQDDLEDVAAAYFRGQA